MYAGRLMSPNAEVLQRSGISTIGDILRHRRLSLFGHPTKAERQWPAGEDHRVALTTSSPTGFRRMPTIYSYLRCGDAFVSFSAVNENADENEIPLSDENEKK